jgi:hypothetical protein
MNEKKAIGIIVTGLALTGLLFLLTRKAKASEETPTSVSELKSRILNAGDFTELNGYYNQIGGLLTAGTITLDQYYELYIAYARRFYQLTGVEE